MKKLLLPILFTLLFITALTNSYAQKVVIAAKTGQWKSLDTWIGNYIPVDGDIAVIPSGITVTFTPDITNQLNQTNGAERLSNPKLYVYGTLVFYSPIFTYQNEPRVVGTQLLGEGGFIAVMSGGKYELAKILISPNKSSMIICIYGNE